MSKEINYLYFAEAQIHKAMDLYLEDNLQGYVCALSLAGSAQGLLGGYLKEHNSLAELKKIILKNTEASEKEIIKELNEPYNSMKHYIEINEFKPVDSSLLMIMRAIRNYSISFDGVTQQMQNFVKDSKVKSDLENL